MRFVKTHWDWLIMERIGLKNESSAYLEMSLNGKETQHFCSSIMKECEFFPLKHLIENVLIFFLKKRLYS